MKTKIKNKFINAYEMKYGISTWYCEYKRKSLDEKRDDLWDYMLFHEIATEDEMRLVTDINGFRLDVLESILYARTGYHDLKQYIYG